MIVLCSPHLHDHYQPLYLCCTSLNYPLLGPEFTHQQAEPFLLGLIFVLTYRPCCAGPRKPPRLGSPSQEDKVEISTGTQKATVGVSTLHRNIDSQAKVYTSTITAQK